MPVLTTKEELKDYCLRKLGAPVINIEVDDVQAYDRIDDAIDFYLERHFNGTTEIYYKHVVTRQDVINKFISLPKEIVSVNKVLQSSQNTSGEVMFDVEFQLRQDFNNNRSTTSGVSDYYIAMSSIALLNNLMTPEKQFTYNNATRKFTPLWNLNDVGSANLLKSQDDIESADWTKINSIASANSVMDPLKTTNGDSIESIGPGIFGISQLYDTANRVTGTVSAWVSIESGTYTGPITMTITDSAGTIVGTKTIQPDSLWRGEFITVEYTDAHKDDIILTITGNASAAGESFNIYNPWLYVNKIIVLNGYSSIDPNTAIDLYNDRWLKKYTTVLFKEQWGQNLMKLGGIQLAGGIELNGDKIYDAAIAEKQQLEEQFSLEYELPVDMQIR